MIAAALSLLLAAAPAPPLKLAVVVGSKGAVANRPALRFAHDDARAFARALQDTAGFAPQGVQVLLEPRPGAVLAALDQAREVAKSAGRETLLVFYYSGHTDEQSLYPGGEALALADLKARLADEALGVRIGVIDGCHGGGWTQAKGLRPTEAFEVSGPAGLGTEGLALLAASSGSEDAHEAEVLKGSFFTHHLVAGMRGAADKSGDGQVTLSEAIAYASRLTIRDTAARAPEPQHPSFDLRLRGRQDVVLSAPAQTRTLLTVNQTEGPLELVELSSGVVVLEATPGPQKLVLSVAPGDYLVRRVSADGVKSREVTVKAGEAATIDEGALVVKGEAMLASKGTTRLHRWSLGGSTGATVSDPFQVGLKIELRGEVRFLTRLAVRLRAAWHQNVQTGLRDQLERDFGVIPTAFTQVTSFYGADAVVYPWWSERYGDGFGIALIISAGAGVGTFRLAGNPDFAEGAFPMASIEAGFSISLFTGLTVEILATQNFGFRSKVLGLTNFGLGVSWAFL